MSWLKKIKIEEVLVWLTLFSLPWQTRWIFLSQELNGQTFEYGQLALYGSQILLFISLVTLAYKNKLKYVNSHWLGVLFAWLVISLLWTQSIILTFYWLTLFLVALGYYVVVKASPRIITYTAIIASAVVQSILAILQFASQQINPNKWLGLAEHSPEVLGQSVIVVDGLRMLRAYGSLVHPNMLGGFLAVSLIVLFFWIVSPRYKYSFKNAVLTLVTSGFIFMGLMFSFSRSALLTLGFFSLVVLIYGIFKKAIWTRVILSLIITWVASAAFLSFALPDIFYSRFETQSRLEQMSNNGRIEGVEQAEQIISSNNILLGVGAGNYTLAAYTLDPSLEIYDYQPVHNIYILALAELGAVGLFIFLRILYSNLKQSGRRVLMLLPVLFLGLFDHWLVSQYFGLSLFLVILGLIASKEVKPEVT